MSGAHSLAALQDWFVAVTSDTRSLSDAARDHARLLGGAGLDEVMSASERESAEERLAIYRNAYFARLEECLISDYPAVASLLGVEKFAELCVRYVTEHPSQSPNLNAFGRHFSEFLSRQLSSDPFAAELARLEWALVEAIHSAAGEPLAEEALRAVPPDRLGQLRFRPNPALLVLDFEFAVNRYLQAHFRDEAPKRPTRQASHVAVVRVGYQIWRLDLTPAQRTVLGRLQGGAALGEAFGGVDVNPSEAMSWFRLWTEKNFFSGVELG